MPQVVVSSRMQDGEMLDSIALPTALDVVAIIIDGIILLTGET